jgi:hypothetical protein
MSSYKCNLCCQSYNKNDCNVFDKYYCDCGRNVCKECIEYISIEQFKCNICAGIPSEVLDTDYDCVCEICGDYNCDRFGIQIDKHGLEINPFDNLEKYPNGDIYEFCNIIRMLNDQDLETFHHILIIDDEIEQRIYLRNNRTTCDGILHNALSAKVLVSEPIVYVKNEIDFRKKINYDF